MNSLSFQGDSEVFALASCPLHLPLTTCQCCYCSQDRWKNKASQDGSQTELTIPNRVKSTWHFGTYPAVMHAGRLPSAGGRWNSSGWTQTRQFTEQGTSKTSQKDQPHGRERTQLTQCLRGWETPRKALFCFSKLK